MFGLFFACAVLPVCALAVLSLRQVAENTRKESRVLLRHTSKNVTMTVHELLLILQHELGLLASHGAGMPGGPGGSKSDLVTGESRFRGVTVFRDGAIRTVSGAACPYPPLSAAARKHLAAGKTLLFLQAVPDGADRMFIATALDPKRPESLLLVGEINASYLWEVVGYTLPPGISACILDPSGNVLFASLAPTSDVLSRVMALLPRSTVGEFETRRGSQSRLVSYRQVFLKYAFGAEPLTVIATQSAHDAYLPLGQFARTFYLVVSLTLLVVIFISSRQIRRNLVPLSVLEEGAQRISQGDFEHRVILDSGDEFERLAGSFNDMSDHLKKHFHILSETGRIVRAILSVRNTEEIVDAVLSRFPSVVRCNWVCVSLIHPMIKDTAVNFFRRCTPGGPAAVEQAVTLLNAEETAMLRGTGDSLHVAAGGDHFGAFLAPMAADDTRDSYLLPVFIKKSLYGILALGYRQETEHLQEDLLRARQIADQIAVALENARLIEELNQLNLGTIRALANAVDAKSPWTSGHSLRVTNIALNLGREMGLGAADLELLHKGGLFHDIGKIGVPESILDKAGKLTDEEFAAIRKHPEIGVEILRPIEAYQKLIPVVLQHHEWFNGKGYPHGLAGEAISRLARILAVADVYDALISDRPYREGWEHGRVISYLQENSGRQFDPAVVQAVMRIHDRDALERCAVEDQGQAWMAA